VIDFAGDRPLAAAIAPPAADPGALAAGRQKAAAIAHAVAGSDTQVALLGEGAAGDDSAAYLPFLLETTELYVFTGPPAKAAASFLAPLPRLGEQTIGGTTVRRILLYGHPSAAISYLSK
jgi:hypothetical protein